MRITLADGYDIETDNLSDFEESSSAVYWGGEPECEHEWKDNSPPYGMKACNFAAESSAQNRTRVIVLTYANRTTARNYERASEQHPQFQS